ncbi:HD domain-containing phosphohydrolase [Thermodesulfobacteriota bacterium]
MKFRDLTNGEVKPRKPSPKKKDDTSGADARLSFRKLAAEHKKKLPADEAVSEKAATDKDQIGESGPVLYQKTAAYLKQVFEAVKRRKMFSLDPGLQIIREMVEIQSFHDSLFIEALHFDDSLHFIINNNVNVAIYAIKMAENLGFGKDRKIEIGMAGLMHDVGMALIPEKLIYKKERLSEAEFRIFKERQNYSYKILQSFGEDYAYLAECAVQVNERLNGSGYPQGLQGDEINEYAQIIGLVDMYEALIHSRPQREKFLHFIAVKEIIKSGKNLFQRKHLKALLNIFSIFPLHSHVRLNSNAVGKVIETYPDLPMRPRIQIIFDSQQRRVLTERIVNLPDDPLLFIVDSASDEELQQLSEGPAIEKQAKADRKQKRDDILQTPKEEAAAVDDELPPGIEAVEDQTDHKHKVGWLKPALIIGAIALLATGLVLQFVNKDSKPLDAGKLQTSIMKQEPGGAPLQGSADISLPPAKKSTVREDVAQEKPTDYQEPDLKKFGSSSKAIVEETAPSSSVNGVVVSEKAVSDKEQAAGIQSQIVERHGTQKIETPKKSEPDVIAVKKSYPYSIKLTYFRSREKAEKALVVYREKGLAPYWVKVKLGDQGIWYRVFAGYFEDIPQAEEIIKTLGLKGALVKETKFASLIGSYQSETDLNSRIQQILKLGFSPYVVKGAEGKFYLYVGAFYTRKGAKDQYNDLLAAGIESKVVER